MKFTFTLSTDQNEERFSRSVEISEDRMKVAFPEEIEIALEYPALHLVQDTFDTFFPQFKLVEEAEV